MIDPLIGLGLRQPHYELVTNHLPPIGWFEVHAENFLQKGGATPALLQSIGEHYPISLHGVGLSLGSSTGLNTLHLQRLKSLIDSIAPFLVSEHLSWNQWNGVNFPDLLPLPYHESSLKILAQNVEHAQTYLGCELIIENPSSYLEFVDSTMNEVDFLVELCQMTGAKMLLDVNNLYVSAQNHQWNAWNYIQSIPQNVVKEIHLAGHSLKILSDQSLLRIDTHDGRVCDEVWDLYRLAIQRFGRVPTLIEWDANIPNFEVLTQEAMKASTILNQECVHA